MHSLKLANHQGYPQLITVQASSNSPPDIGVTVQDVLRAIHEDMRTLARVRELISFLAEEQAQINAAFRKRCRTADELGQGPCRFDCLKGRDRLQILPKPEEIFKADL